MFLKHLPLVATGDSSARLVEHRLTNVFDHRPLQLRGGNCGGETSLQVDMK